VSAPPAGASRALVWLRARQLRASTAYWLGVVGLDVRPGLGGWLYTLYFVLIAMGWLAYAWADMLAVGVSAGATGAVREVIARALPTAVGFLQAGIMAALAGSAAVRLSWPDRDWLVTVPLPAWTYVADAWAALARPAIALGLVLASVAAAALDGGVASVPAALVPALAVTLVSLSLALLPAATGRAGRRRRPWLPWLLAIGWAGAAIWLPAAREPARAFVAIARGGALDPWLIPLAAWAIACALLLAVVARTLNLTWATDDSRGRTERQSVASLAWTDPGAARAYLAERRAASRRRRGAMARWPGLWALPARQVVTWLREPRVALALVELGLKVWTGLWICLNPATGLAWVPWLVVVLATGRRSLSGLVWGGARSPFVDQFLPWPDIRRLWAELVLPGSIVTAAAWAAWWVRPAAPGWLDALSALVAAPALAFLLLIASAGDAALPGRRRRVDPGLAASVLIAVVLIVAAAWRSPVASALVAVAGCLAIVRWLEGPRGTVARDGSVAASRPE